MGEVLSQQEIDQLLNAISSGEIDEEEIEKEQENEERQRIKNYDFRRPNKLSKDHISTIEMIYDNYSRIVANYLSAQIRSNVKVDVISVEQVTYEEFMKSIPNPTLLSIFQMPPLQGALLLEVNPQFGFQMIDLLCGGSAEHKQNIRGFTDIETNIIKEVVGEMIGNMKLAWEDVLEVDPKLDDIETNPQVNQIMSPNEPVALVTFSAEISESKSYMNLCIPYLAVENIIDKLYIQHWFENEERDEYGEYYNTLTGNIMPSKVDLNVLLGKTKITVNDFLDLSLGDVIELDKSADKPLRMYVEDQLHFHVQPGIYNNKLSVQVVDIVEKDVDNDE